MITKIILVDDYSTDKTWEKILNLKKLFPEIIGLKLSKFWSTCCNSC